MDLAPASSDSFGPAPRSHERAAVARFPSEAPSAAAASRGHLEVPEFGVVRLGVAGSAEDSVCPFLPLNDCLCFTQLIRLPKREQQQSTKFARILQERGEGEKGNT